MRKIIGIVALLIIIINFNSQSEQKVTCPSGDTTTCMVLKNGDEYIGTIYKGDGGVKGEKII
jgi:hypothetical protein